MGSSLGTLSLIAAQISLRVVTPASFSEISSLLALSSGCSPNWSLKYLKSSPLFFTSSANSVSSLEVSSGLLIKLVLVVFEVLSPLLHLLGELGLQLGGLLWVVDLQVEVEVGRVASSERLAIDINNWFLSKVDPEDVLLVSVLLEDGLEALLETLHRGLTSSKEWEARQPAEVGGTIGP